MSSYRLAIVGGGNMGAALVTGLLAAGWDADDLLVVEVVEERRAALAGQFPDVAIAGALSSVDAAVIAVKPPDVAAATAAAGAAGARRILSIAAGVTLATLETAAGHGVAVVRAMPNTPALVRQGASAIHGGSAAGAADLDWARSILAAVGTVVEVDETQLDAVTGLAGSGPAYLFLVAEALEDAGVAAGLEPATAAALVAQLMVGSAALLAARGDPAGLRAMVTSPGGTTAEGVRVLEEHGVRAAFIEAVRAAAQRSRELGI